MFDSTLNWADENIANINKVLTSIKVKHFRGEVKCCAARYNYLALLVLYPFLQYNSVNVDIHGPPVLVNSSSNTYVNKLCCLYICGHHHADPYVIVIDVSIWYL